MRLPDPIANTTTEAYLAYKAGVLAEGDLKPKLYEPYIHLDAWLAYWTGLTKNYPVKNVGKNLFDIDNLEGHYFYNSNTYQPNSENLDWDCSQPIPVESNTTYTISMGLKSGASFSNAQIIYWDADKNGVGSVWGNIRTTLTTGADVKFMTIAYRNTTWENVQLEKGSTATAYEPYTGEPEMLTDEEAYIAYLSGVTDTYPEEFKDPADIRVAAYLRYLISARFGRPEYPVTNEEFYLSLQKPPYVPSGDPSSDIVIEDTIKAPFIDVKMYGDTYQQSYEGKNLFNFDLWKETSTTRSGVTWTPNADQSVTSEGTSLNSYAGCFFEFRESKEGEDTKLEPGTYYIKAISSNTNVGVYGLYRKAGSTTTLALFLATASGSTASFTIPDNEQYQRVWFRLVAMGSNLDCSGTTRVILSKDKSFVDAGVFEPYVGGIASPNPDYPQPVQTVTGEQTVEVRGKNLFDKDNPNIYHYNPATQGQALQPLPGANTVFVKIQPNADITVSSTDRSKLDTYASVVFINGEPETATTWITRTQFGNNDSVSVTSPANATYIGVYAVYSNTQATIDASLATIQIEYGSTPTTYEPYASTEYPLDLGDIELCKLGTYQDYIWKDGDTWKVHKATGKFVFTQETTPARGRSKNGNIGFVVDAANNPIPNKHIPLIGVCSCFAVESTTTTWTGINRTGVNTSGALWFQTGDSSNPDTRYIAQFFEWLEGSNATYNYALATPTDTEITNTALIDQLEALSKGGSEEGTTYIKVSASDPNLPGLLYVEAAKDVD